MSVRDVRGMCDERRLELRGLVFVYQVFARSPVKSGAVSSLSVRSDSSKV